ncbi:MAG: ABC transporter substrate-binding protein [Desulfomonile tiedjei]|nr:ABC transporter substrate-binding protein [Desulfomonile tiedjei]
MRHSKGFIGFVFFLAVALASAWLAAGASAQATKEVVIGFSGPLSGVAAEYGQDCANGVEMAIKEINAAGGITVGADKCMLKLVKLDDRIDPTEAVNNSRKLMDQHKAPAVFNPVFNTLAAMARVNQEKGQEFILMAYTSTPKAMEMGNKLLTAIPPPFTVYVKAFSDLAWKKGWRKVAMVVTLGAYGDEWRHAFKEYWQDKGGQISADKPANYYTETDFSSQLTAALATKPDALLIGGPSATTALVMEQARGLGYKGGFILIDQAKMDYIANILKGTKLMGETIGVAAVAQSPTAASADFDKKYVGEYKRMLTWEVALNYSAMHALARAMVAAGTVKDPVAIQAAFPKAFPLEGDKFPSTFSGITPGGRMQVPGSVQMIGAGGKYSPVRLVTWWLKSRGEFNDSLQQMQATGQLVGQVVWMYYKFEADL